MGSDGRGEPPGAREQHATYCVVPAELAGRLLGALMDHFAGDPAVEVMVERRGGERRSGTERRVARGPDAPGPPGGRERRRIRNRAGRRVADRRASTVPVEMPQLPRLARRHAERLTFVQRIDSGTEAREDADTGRLVVRFQAGEEETFVALYERYFPRVYGFLRVFLQGAEEAEDAAQEVFLSVFERLSDFELRDRPFRAWLFTLVRNQAIDVLRGAQRIEPLDPEAMERRREREPAEAPGPALDWLSDSDLLLFVERLPHSQRQVLMLRHVMDLSASEIARIVGRSPADVRMLQSRAHRFLRDRLTAVGRHYGGRRSSRMRERVRPAVVLRLRRFALTR